MQFFAVLAALSFAAVAFAAPVPEPNPVAVPEPNPVAEAEPGCSMGTGLQCF
jgi:hypothetical protein